MRLYIDDDSVDPSLFRLLRRDGHDVRDPADVGLAGSSDQVHLAHAIRDQRAILTRNHRDFQPLHDLVVFAAQGHHGAPDTFRTWCPVLFLKRKRALAFP